MKNVFAKGYTPNWSVEVFIIKRVKILCREHMQLVILMNKKLLEHFTKKNCKNQIKKKVRIEKVIKRKGDKLYVKWKEYNNSFR